METTLQTGVKIGAKPERMSVVRVITSRIAWLYDRFVFHIIYRGERLRPEVQEQLRKDVEDAEKGINVSPVFTNADDLITWLDSKKK